MMAARFVVNEPEKEAWALQHLKVQMTDTFGPAHLLLIIFLRLVCFDFWLYVLSEIKYRTQRASWWKKVREWRLVRALDWCWQAPKRWLFDRETRAWRQVISFLFFSGVWNEKKVDGKEKRKQTRAGTFLLLLAEACVLRKRIVKRAAHTFMQRVFICFLAIVLQAMRITFRLTEKLWTWS